MIGLFVLSWEMGIDGEGGEIDRGVDVERADVVIFVAEVWELSVDLYEGLKAEQRLEYDFEDGDGCLFVGSGYWAHYL